MGSVVQRVCAQQQVPCEEVRLRVGTVQLMDGPNLVSLLRKPVAHRRRIWRSRDRRPRVVVSRAEDGAMG
ncbi:MAG: hypothetical protein F4099_08065 [Synechococcus sp. SB0673_bin_10]|nr:hypothetical protein [Synechococcus sp. SB0667_bin_8]MYF35772.1 hypothetical protein [Synechococcus sp. SB0678_bin_12]MYG64225.1 hypothetical protein [Synechococcus sp. SB0675_bin_7]MYI72434.1 hypothetical protein [Synechococcus sp. SB0673_bin_10]MYI87711.1 hypothetical protein [Synechococcus sp. SB0672_bin_10]MYK86846.1 hypothetical protein [Synechococcus sp. SB0669_bin_7]